MLVSGVGTSGERDDMAKAIDHNVQPLEKWRDGVMTRMRVSALSGGHQLCIFEQYCDSGLGAPMHIHAVEEVLEVIVGTAEIAVGDDKLIVTANQSVLIPAGKRHGFKNVGAGILHVRATLAASIFEGAYDDKSETSRRWSPQE
jgi:mannose-6-phosphate isomerase-like protein (cupin superfamily)